MGGTMSTAVMPESRSVTALAKVETLRLARHPAFLIGAVITVVSLLLGLGTSLDYYNITVIPAFFLGLPSLVATFRMTRSMERTEEALGSAPSSAQDRVLALCAACALPAVLGVLSAVAILVVQDVSQPYAYGTWNAFDRAGIVFTGTAIACLGAPLLGIAAGRWLRFPGAVVVPVLGLIVVGMISEIVATADRSSGPLTFVRLLSPWTQFTATGTDNREVETWRGSPWWYAGWLVALCLLAVLGALLKGLEGERRTRVLRVGFVVGVIGLACLVVAVLVGPDIATVSTPAGVRPF